MVQMGTQLTNQLSESKYRQSLLNAMVTGNKQEINLILRSYKNENGSICFHTLFAIPAQARIPALAKNDYAKIAAPITAGLTLAFESMNLARPMKMNQI